jgi:hypothetical protein
MACLCGQSLKSSALSHHRSPSFKAEHLLDLTPPKAIGCLVELRVHPSRDHKYARHDCPFRAKARRHTLSMRTSRVNVIENDDALALSDIRQAKRAWIWSAMLNS